VSKNAYPDTACFFNLYALIRAIAKKANPNTTKNHPVRVFGIKYPSSGILFGIYASGETYHGTANERPPAMTLAIKTIPVLSIE
jgi:hypothetical protein